jgi:hypothetical protein
MVDIRLNLLAILDQDAKSTMLDLAYIGKGETYTRIPDMYSCPEKFFPKS